MEEVRGKTSKIVTVGSKKTRKWMKRFKSAQQHAKREVP
jgi:hypothetical protein